MVMAAVHPGTRTSASALLEGKGFFPLNSFVLLRFFSTILP